MTAAITGRPAVSVELETRARRIAAKKMGLFKDPTGLGSPEDLWRQALPQARIDAVGAILLNEHAHLTRERDNMAANYAAECVERVAERDRAAKAEERAERAEAEVERLEGNVTFWKGTASANAEYADTMRNRVTAAEAHVVDLTAKLDEARGAIRNVMAKHDRTVNIEGYGHPAPTNGRHDRNRRLCRLRKSLRRHSAGR